MKPKLKYLTKAEAKHVVDDLGFEYRNLKFYFEFTFGRNSGIEYAIFEDGNA